MAKSYKPAGEKNVESEREEPGPTHIPGMGLGAMPQAILWARMGYHFEQLASQVEKLSPLHECLKRERGRPKLDPIQSKDAMRAFCAWHMLRHLRKVTGKPQLNPTNRDLIQLCRRAEASLKIPTNERVFPERGNYESSVSRGRAILEIDDTWQSLLCEKIDQV